jgi:hypothetical protein
MDLSDEALIAYLESRYMGLVGHGVLPRLLLKAQVLTSTLSKRLGIFSSSVLTEKQQQHRIWTTMWQHAMRPVVVVTLRELSSAQPLGP